METSSYDELVKKIASLQAENSHLRQYVHYKASHMTRLEQESSSMRDALSTNSQDDLAFNEEPSFSIDQSESRGAASSLAAFQVDRQQIGEEKRDSPAGLTNSALSKTVLLSDGSSSHRNIHSPQTFSSSAGRNESVHGQSKPPVLDQSKGDSLLFNQSQIIEALFPNKSQPASLDQLNSRDSAFGNYSYSALFDQSAGRESSFVSGAHSQPSSLGAVNHRTTSQNDSLPKPSSRHTSLPYFTHQSKQAFLDHLHVKTENKSSVLNQSKHGAFLDQSLKNGDTSFLNQSNQAFLDQSQVVDQSHPAFLNQSNQAFLDQSQVLDQSHPGFLDQSQTQEGHEGGAEELDQNNSALNESTLRHAEAILSGDSALMAGDVRRMGLGQRLQSGAMATPTANSPGKRRNNNDRELYSYLQELDQQRTAILHDIESEDKLRKWYYEQLEVFTKKIESLPLTETYNLQADMNRRQLEHEIQKLRESLQENLGSSESIATRHEARLHKIHMIEREMLRLQQRHGQFQDHERPSSGPCDQIEPEREEMALVDACTNTSTAGEAFVPVNSEENTAYTSDRGVCCRDNGMRVITIATQTSEVVIPDFDSLPDIPVPHSTNMAAMFHGAWPITKGTALTHPETASVMSFNSSNSHGSAHSSPSPPKKPSNQQLGTKYPCFVAPQVEMVYSLLSMLGTHDKDDMSRTLLAMSSSQDSCIAMRQSGCMPLLIQLLHGSDKESGLLGNTRGSKPARARAAAALHNIVHSHPDDKRGRREARVLRLLEQIRAHCDQLRDLFDAEALEEKSAKTSDIDHHPGPAIAALMKLSFDEEHRHAICTLGGLQAIAELLEVDQLIHDNTSEQYNITMRRYACMALTNLTFGDGTNKALLCSMKSCMEALVAQLRSPNEDLCQVAASVLRNLSWRADLASKKTLREVGAVTTLMITAMVVKKESTLKSILSALWNLSAHCSENKADICAVENSLVFLGNTLTYKSPSKTLAIIENGGGILRNVSSHVAIREDYRKVLRQHGCLQILLKHLRSPSLTIVSNACGTLWNLSARCAEDQQALWDMGAVSMLKNLLHSKHKMISMGSAAALKNLLAARPSISANDPLDKQKTNMPSLHVRKQRALEAEIDQSLSETCENVDSPRDSPVDLIGKKEEHDSKRFLYSGGDNVGGFQGHTESEHRRSLVRGQFFPRSGSGDSSPLIENQIRSPQRVARSGSQDSVGSVHSDISHDRSRVQNMLAKSSKLLHERQGGSLDRRKDGHHNLQNCGSRSLDSAAEIYKARQGSPANSRIVQVMKEVALHAGLEGEYNRNHGNKGEKGQLREPPNRRLGGFQPPELKDTPALGQANAEVSENGKNNERGKRDNLRSGEQDDQPVNYSMKYNNRTEEEQESREDPKNNQNFGSSLNNRPVPKVGNYVGSAFISQQEMPNMVRNNFPAPKNIQAERNFYNGKPPMSGSNKKLNALHETDYATDDQPTDYSRLYAEHSESDEHPVNYSSHYRDCADCKLEEARRTNDMLEQMMGDNDCVRTFYTEGTPLNYMSTATSMTDLSAHVHVHRPDANKSVMHQVPEDEAGAFSTHFEKEDNQNDGLSESVREVYNESQQERPAIAPESESHSPSEKPKTYCEEGTPICFSRVSSLSSLHSSDARDRNEASGKQGGELQSIDEAETSFEHGAKKRDKSVKPLGKEGISPGNVESPEKEHKTVTWDDNHQVQETPLMFSRCSSLGSLSSFDAHSVHSSVLSDYSRRPSGNVSPSDLPDSPSETMPPTPRCKSPSRAGGSASNYKGGETVLSSEENKTDTVKAAEAEERSRGAQKRNDELKLTTERSQREENIQMAEDLHIAHDVPVTYATEDTPLNFSETTSLSGLSVCPEEETMIENPDATKETPKPKPWKSPVKTGKEEHEHDSSLSEVSEGEEDILAECISSAMPNNTNRRMKKSASDHAIKKKVGIFKIENLNQNKSKLPTKIINTTKAGPLSPPGAQRSIPVARKPPLPPAVDAEPDTTKSYATEGTPLNFSRTGSLSDISICTDRSVGKMVDPLERVAFEEDSKSDNSSFMDDHDDILSQVIQSAMPKGKSAKKSPSSSDLKDSKGAASKEKKQLSPAKRPPMKFRQDGETQFLTGGDTMKTFAVEGTPINFSTATSLSDLTMESFEGMDRKLSDQEENEQKVLSENVSMNATGNASILDSRLEDSVFLQDVAACDSPRVYGVEGTPMSFSRSDSLSSLGCRDEDDGGKKTHSAQPSAIPVKSKLPRRSNQRSLSKLPVASKSFLPTDHVKSDIESSLYQREVIGQSSEESSQADTLLDRDQTKKFEVEGTPYCFSRNSSLSSLHTDDNFTRDNSGEGDQLKVPESEANQKDHQADFKVEGTPVCFSLNSSLSSLSIESSPNAPTQYEQDLLEQCINSAMPKGKANKPTNASSIPRGIPRPGSKPNREKLPQRSPLHIRAEFDADCETPTNSGRPRGGDSDVFYNSPASPHLQKHDRFTSWRRQPHKSCDEIFTSSPFEENKFNWRRSHSQDSENFLKQRKDVSNFEKAQIGGPTTENGDGHGSSRFRQPSLPSVHVVQACSTQLLDNRLQEEGQKAKRTESQDSTQQRDSDGSIEKIDSEKGDSDGTEALTDNVMQLSIKDECSTEDILKETFPANSQADTDDDLLASMEDTLAESEIEADERTFENGGSGDTSCLNETVIHRPDAVCLPEICLPEKADSELSVEDEQDLEANAKIIVSELFIEREMSNSMLEEDMFIENETISLVSNGYNSDTASEVSISWSTSSKTNSEQASEYAASNTSQNENRSIKGPKITKPSDKDNGQQNTKEDNTRAIRGRRKPLYPGNRATSTPVSKAASSSNDSSRIAKANNSTFKAPWNKTPPGAANKKISPKGQGTNQNATKSSPKSKFNKTNTVSTPRPNTNNQRNNVPRVGSQSRLPTASGDKASPPAAKTKGKPSPPERPKPPIKQATFVKEPSGVVSAQSQLTKQQSAGSKSDVSTEGVKLREKKSSTSSSTPSDRHSGGSSGGSQRNSGEAWEKALGGHNFLVDKSQEQGLHAPYEQIQMQKNSNDCPEVLRRNSSNVTKTTTTTITVKISGNSPSGISRIATSNLRKTSSMSPSRCGSSSALNRTGSAGSLRKAGSKQELKKSDSNVSLKKGSNNNSRPSTPSGRRTPTSLNFNGKSQGSLCGTPTKRNETGAGSVRKGAPGSAGKKQITSKIASLWKKDDGGNSSGNSSDKSPPESRIPPKGSRVPSAKKPALPVKPKVIPVKSGQKHSPPGTTPPPQREGISRSSTYDKITLAGEPETRTVPDAAAGEEGNNDSANSSTGESPIARESSTFKEPHPVRLDFDSSTWTKDKTRDPTSLPDSDDTFDGSVWRRYDSDQEEENTADVWVKQGSSITETTPCESGRVAAPCGNSGQSTLDSSSLSDKSLSNNNNNSSSSLANRSLVANTSMMNSSTASTTSTGRRLVRNFGSSALHKAKLSSQVIMANGCSEVEDEAKVLRHVQTPPQFTPNAEQGKNGLEGRIGNTAAAIVAPFNYKPSPIATTAAVSNSTNDQDRQPPVSSPGKRSLVGSPTKHMTKTEMLLARRRSYLNSTKNEENSCEGEEKKRTCLVTTV